jgi:hypothetical protein
LAAKENEDHCQVMILEFGLCRGLASCQQAQSARSAYTNPLLIQRKSYVKKPAALFTFL